MSDYNTIKHLIKNQAPEFGFLEAKIVNLKIDSQAQSQFREWLDKNFHGEMNYLNNNHELRFNPSILHPGSLSIIMVKAPYLNKDVQFHIQRLNNIDKAYVSSYALGRDYHKVVKQQLNKYAKWINELLDTYQLEHNYRCFTDSAPIMEVELAQSAGLGWRGKNTLLIHKQQGSLFFLGEIFTNLPLAPDEATPNHCGSCQKCLQVCPTNAFDAPYVLNATKCIAYLTIENPGTIPIEFRKAMGNRIYGCDDCQIFCPWNKFSQLTSLIDFATRNNLDDSTLLELFAWTKPEFEHRMQGSPIYRIGYESWMRNIAVALGNASYSTAIINALNNKLPKVNPMVAEHISWAIAEQSSKINTQL